MDVDPERGRRCARSAATSSARSGRVAEQKGLEFEIERRPTASPAAIETDEQRLQQMLKNLLSNAFKFTDAGQVELRIRVVAGRRRASRTRDARAGGTRPRLRVTDTGIGIPKDKLQLIFEAFQQADGTTSRKYGGTGLGLSISREIARLLGGEIHVESAPGKGSTSRSSCPPGSRRRRPRARTRRSRPSSAVSSTEIAARSGVRAHEPIRCSLLPGEVADDRDDDRAGRPGRRSSSRTTRTFAKTLLGRSRASAASRASSRQRGDAGLALVARVQARTRSSST